MRTENVLQEANHTFELNIRLFSSFASSLPVDMSSAPPPHSHPVLSTQSSPSSPGGKCPFRNLKFAANASHTATLDLVKHKSLLTSLQTPLVAILVLLLAFVAHQLITNLS